MKSIFEKILLAVGSILLARFSYTTLIKIHEFESDNWFLIIFIAWVINMIVTGVFALLTFGFSVQKLLPEAYYKIQNPKKLKAVCKSMKIELFRKFLLATLWKNPKQRAKHFDGTVAGIKQLEIQSKKAEFGHLFPFILLIFVSGYLFYLGLWKLGISTLLINVLGNFYPIILQRHHRMRTSILKRRYALKLKRNSETDELKSNN